MRIWAMALMAGLMVVAGLSGPPAQGANQWEVRILGAGTDSRVALVIGNGAYHDAPLRNPGNDARLMAATLRELGFEVTLLLDAGQTQMKRAIQDFGDRLDESSEDSVGLFYFSGHGAQVKGVNYLLPVGARIRDESDVEIEAVDAGWVLNKMEFARNGLNIVILDACRNNPFERSFRSAARGLARMEAPRGTLVAYATAPGDVAYDGDGQNSPYTAALTAAMRQPGHKVEDTFKLVRLSVMDATEERQVPWESSSLTGDFYFGGADGAAPVARTTIPATEPVRQAALPRSAPDAAAPLDVGTLPGADAAARSIELSTPVMRGLAARAAKADAASAACGRPDDRGRAALSDMARRKGVTQRAADAARTAYERNFRLASRVLRTDRARAKLDCADVEAKVAEGLRWMATQ